MCSLSVFLCAAHCAYSINNNNNKKLTKRRDSERELFLRRHRTRTTKYNRLVHKFRLRLVPKSATMVAILRYSTELDSVLGQLRQSGWRQTLTIWDTDLYKYSSRCRIPPIDGESYHVATDKVLAKDGDKFRSILATIYLQPIATRGKKARRLFQASTCYLGEFLLVDQHCGNGCSMKCAPLFVSYYNKISGGHIGSSVVRTRCSAGLVLLLWSETPV